jgi:UDP-N-acetylmuramoyl-L-alanyl-D-glutamate--2,6-diaminopimelate ligase
MHPLATWLRATVAPDAELAADSRAVGAGDAFLAYPGARHDARAFIPDVVARGAAAVLWERDGFAWDPAWRAAQLPVIGLKGEAGAIAAGFYGDPSRQVPVIGVTGTSGKTSCTLWIAQALSALGRRTAVAGTLGTGFVGELVDTGLTTPDPVWLQRTLARLVKGGAQALAMEVSSVGLVEGRLNGMHVDTAVFTNLTRDHLDYHGDMQAYGAAKARLFEWPGLRAAVINVDDALGRQLAARAAERGLTAWTTSASGDPQARLRAARLEHNAQGMRFALEVDGASRLVQTPLIGAYNVGNLLQVVAVLLAQGVELDAALHALAGLEPAPGRLHRVPAAHGPLVLVDYAHKPDALEKALAACRPMAHARGGKLVVVFGCGGDRDPGKRPEMGRIAAQLADLVVITSDNPRSEDPDRIIEAILAGVPDAGGAAVRQERDRRLAILESIRTADQADVILIAGKGHETYQEIAGVKLPFSDLDVASQALQREA